MVWKVVKSAQPPVRYRRNSDRRPDIVAEKASVHRRLELLHALYPPLVFALYLDCIQNSDRYNCICVYAKPCMSVFPM